MTAIPAQIAGCSNIVVLTPPNKNGSIPKEIAYVAKLCNIKRIYTIGGAQAIASVAIGTESIPKVKKIV